MLKCSTMNLTFSAFQTAEFNKAQSQQDTKNVSCHQKFTTPCFHQSQNRLKNQHLECKTHPGICNFLQTIALPPGTIMMCNLLLHTHVSSRKYSRIYLISNTSYNQAPFHPTLANPKDTSVKRRGVSRL